MNTTYLKIDYNNDKHIEYITKLCKRNNFYILEILLFYDTINVLDKTEKMIGLFILKEKKIIGFVLMIRANKTPFWCTNKITKEEIKGKKSGISIEFLLIDKLYQKKREGTKIINHIKQNVLKKDQYIIIPLGIKDVNNLEFYEKNGFCKELDYNSSIAFFNIKNKEVKIFCDYMRVQNIKSAWDQLLIEPLYYYKSY